MATISIEVGEAAAKAFTEASSQERRKMQLLLDLRLREITNLPGRSLSQIMDDMSARAAERGLTEEKLQLLLRDL